MRLRRNSHAYIIYEHPHQLWFYGNKPEGRAVKYRKTFRAVYIDGTVSKAGGGLRVDDYMVPACMDGSRIMREHHGQMKEALIQKLAAMKADREWVKAEVYKLELS